MFVFHSKHPDWLEASLFWCINEEMGIDNLQSKFLIISIKTRKLTTYQDKT